jgi:hypothetical protein
MLLATSITGLLSTDGGPKNAVQILRPVMGDSLAYDQGKLFIASVAKSTGTKLVVSTQWKVEGVFDLATEDLRNNFAKDFFKVVPSQTTIERFTYHFVLFQGYSPSETLSFA